MSVFIDDAAIPYRGKPRYHLAADSLEELHAFAQRVGIKRCWFHRGRFAHYDVTSQERERALACGACALTRRELVARMLAGHAGVVSTSTRQARRQRDAKIEP
jgi:hypothetical protein